MQPKSNLRQCISCRNKKPKQDLFCFTKMKKDNNTYEAVFKVDSFCFGRSAYVCKNKECILKCFKEKKVSKMLRYAFVFSEDLVNELIKKIPFEGVLRYGY